jgi:hypothetical protein
MVLLDCQVISLKSHCKSLMYEYLQISKAKMANLCMVLRLSVFNESISGTDLYLPLESALHIMIPDSNSIVFLQECCGTVTSIKDFSPGQAKLY